MQPIVIKNIYLHGTSKSQSEKLYSFHILFYGMLEIRGIYARRRNDFIFVNMPVFRSKDAKDGKNTRVPFCSFSDRARNKEFIQQLQDSFRKSLESGSPKVQDRRSPENELLSRRMLGKNIPSPKPAAKHIKGIPSKRPKGDLRRGPNASKRNERIVQKNRSARPRGACGSVEIFNPDRPTKETIT